jgi:hypothetical protein
MCSIRLKDKVEVAIELPAAKIVVSADATKLEQVFVNLAMNAADAMEESGTRKLTISATLTDSVIDLAFQDSGPGVPPDKAESLFQPFFTTKEVGKGSGLGLSMVYDQTKIAGGSVAGDACCADSREYWQGRYLVSGDVQMINWQDKDSLRRRGNKYVRAVEVHVIPEWIDVTYHYWVKWSDGALNRYTSDGMFWLDKRPCSLDVIPAPRSGEGMIDPLAEPIARTGEPIYASIQRERSGVDSGVISPRARIMAVEELCDEDQKDIVSASLILLEMVLDNTKPTNHSCRHLLDRVVKKFGVES